MNTIPNPTPADTLRAAATYLRRYGWIQDGYYRHDSESVLPAACALGAIGMAVHGHAFTDPQDSELPGWSHFEAARELLRQHLTTCGLLQMDDSDPLTVAEWNDYAATADAVIRAFGNAAHAWDLQHPAGTR